MPIYLLQVDDTLDGIRGVLAKGGSDRKAAAQAAVKSAAGKIESLYFAFGSRVRTSSLTSRTTPRPPLWR